MASYEIDNAIKDQQKVYTEEISALYDLLVVRKDVSEETLAWMRVTLLKFLSDYMRLRKKEEVEVKDC
ncbi:hypothetical protein GMA8713_01118 [Grimontia marina]|uniref:Uncharacterized protein n=1 Tax=Grimontia marina TaxID=646534 RepID=A0A128F0H8_9GAMM|nr:hypothetical protein GMA8713_01118 [Grimontia marina]